MRLVSWNVNGIRAAVKKGFLEAVEHLDADVLCLQETKAQDEQVIEALSGLEGYRIFTNSAEKKGYAGTAILSRLEPLDVSLDIGVDEHDREGRVTRAELEDCHLVTVYTPNSGNGLKRLDYREQWDAAFLCYLQRLEADKPVIVCGDLNVAHREIDLARPKANYNKTAGYTQREIDGMDNLISAGYVDTFRHLYPEEVRYSWWSYRGGAREKNVGWRLDYFIVSDSLKDRIVEAEILNEVTGSDHCPVVLQMTDP